MNLSWIRGAVARLLIAILDSAVSLLFTMFCDSEEIFGVRVFGSQEDLRAIRPELEIVNRYRPSALQRLSKATGGMICWTRCCVDLRRRRAYVNMNALGGAAYDVVAASRALQLFPAVGSGGENLKRIGDMVVRDVLVVLSRRLASEGLAERESQAIVRKQERYLRHAYIGDLWNHSLGRRGTPR
jgi:hypothetical protein